MLATLNSDKSPKIQTFRSEIKRSWEGMALALGSLDLIQYAISTKFSFVHRLLAAAMFREGSCSTSVRDQIARKTVVGIMVDSVIDRYERRKN
ncbi:hypothetical protein EVAR_83507_1 [Eumeta japonica]|uniref:Uncharacterized protein n=1 Tax=Eumeta variegata TaxID=151549 RepID=A0A4C1Y1B9_EUMVA|nr:hypothetical protein EVAR_83507_1 [Eumeta japonica]